MKKLFFALITLVVYSNIHASAAPAAPTFPITVRTLIKRTITVDATAATTIAQLKAMIHDAEGIPADQQRFVKHEPRKLWIFSAKPVDLTLENHRTCAYYDLTSTSNISLILHLRGGHR